MLFHHLPMVAGLYGKGKSSLTLPKVIGLSRGQVPMTPTPTILIKVQTQMYYMNKQSCCQQSLINKPNKLSLESTKQIENHVIKSTWGHKILNLQE